MKKNILLLLFCFLLSGCYINKFSEYTIPEVQGPDTWAPINFAPIYIDTNLPYVTFVNTDNIIYIYKNKKNQLIYLEHNPQQNTTKQHNISSVLSPNSTLLQLSYTEYGSQKIVGFIEAETGMFRFKSYIIHNNFNTSLQYDFKVPKFENDTISLKFHTSKQGNLIYLETSNTSSGQKKIQTFNLNPSIIPPSYKPSGKASLATRKEDPYVSLSLNKQSLVLFSGTTHFKTHNFLDDSTQIGPTHSAFTDLRFSLLEENNVWTTFTDTLGMNIVKITIDNSGAITEEVIKTGILGSKGIIAKGTDLSYFLASRNVNNKIEVSKTTNDFQTQEILGVTDFGSTLTDVNLLSLDGIPYLSYVDNDELTILKYSKKDSDSDQGLLPQAKITIDSTTVLGNIPFTISAATSIGNNLSYFWSVSPNEGVNIQNPLNSTTKITLPSSSSKVTITLEINDGSRSSSATQEVTVS